MTRAAIAEARAFESWYDEQEALKRAIAPLSSAQLQRRLIPGLRAPGDIAEHIVSGRALHLHRTLGERAAELTSLLHWDDADAPPHTTAEIVQGLELTWRFITAYLMRGSPSDAVPEDEAPIVQTIWGLLDHDLPHAGELSLLLGADSLPGAGVKNTSIHNTLIDMLGKPIAESNALCIPTAGYGHPQGSPVGPWRFISGGDETLGVVDFSIFPHLDHPALPENTMADAE